MGGPGRSRQRRWPGVRPPPAVSKSHIPGLCAPRPCLAQPIGRRPPFRPSGPAAPRAAGNHSRTFTWRGICGVLAAGQLGRSAAHWRWQSWARQSPAARAREQ